MQISEQKLHRYIFDMYIFSYVYILSFCRYLLEHPGEKEKHHNTGEPDDDAEYETDDEYVSEVRHLYIIRNSEIF